MITNQQSHFWDPTNEDWVQDGSPTENTSTMPVNTAFMLTGTTWWDSKRSPHDPKIKWRIRP